MAKENNLKDLLTDVADAIREKKGTTELINPQDFGSEIRSIESGGITPCEWNDVNFYDYEGTILYSYSWDEFVAKNEMPPLPTHREKEGLICQEWNYTLEEVLEQGGRCDVGAIYIPSDGNTHLLCAIDKGFEVSIICNSETTVFIDWGDGVVDRSDAIGKEVFIHRYANSGNYDIIIGGKCSIYVEQKGFIYKVHLGTNTKIESYCFSKLDSKVNLEITIPNNGEKHSQFCFCGTIIKHINIPQYPIPNIQYARLCRIGKIVVPCNTVNWYYLTWLYDSWINELHIVKEITYFGTDGIHRDIRMKQTVTPANQHLKVINNNIVSIDEKTLCSADCFSPIPEGVENIKGNAMRHNSQRIINFPPSVVNIEPYAVTGSYAFLNLYNNTAIPTLSATNALSGLNNWRIIVRISMLDEWKNATNWSSFSTRMVGVESPVIYYVDGVPNMADINMSWQDMINANLNYANYSVVNGEMKSGNTFITYNGNKVMASDIIVTNGNYITL